MNAFDADRRPEEETEINLTPMLDVVFIMLIFFIVSAVFVKLPGVDVTRPTSRTSRIPESTSVYVAVDRDNEIWLDGHVVEPGQLRYAIEHLHAANPGGGLVIQADAEANNKYALAVMDAANAAGVSPVVLATQRQ